MLKLGKFKAKKDGKKILLIASAIKEKYRTLHSAWQYTDYSWISFLRLLKDRKSCDGTCKLSEQQIPDVVDFVESDRCSCP